VYILILGIKTDGRGLEERVGLMFGEKEIERLKNMQYIKHRLNAVN